MRCHRKLVIVGVTVALFALRPSPSPAAQGQPSRPAAARKGLTGDEQTVVDRLGAPFLNKLTAQGISAKSFLYADRLARVGLRNLATKEYGDAMYLFDKAYSLIRSPNLLLYMAQTYEKLGEFLKARERLLRFAREAPAWTLTKIDAAKVERARRSSSELERRLVSLRLDALPAGTSIFVNGEAMGKSPRAEPLWLMPGFSRVVLAKDGHAPHELLLKETRPGTRLFKRVRLLTREQEIRANALYQEQVLKKQRLQARMEAEQARKARARSKRARVYRIAGWCLTGAGMAALVTGGVFGALADNQSYTVASAAAGTPWTEVQDDYGRAQDYHTAMVVSLASGAGLVAAGAGLVLYGYWTGRDAPERTPGQKSVYFAPSVTPTRVSLLLGMQL